MKEVLLPIKKIIIDAELLPRKTSNPDAIKRLSEVLLEKSFSTT